MALAHSLRSPCPLRGLSISLQERDLRCAKLPPQGASVRFPIRRIAACKVLAMGPSVTAPASVSWRTLHGLGEDGRTVTNWEGLLPRNGGSLNEALRVELLKYGEMAQATYDNFFKDLDGPKFGDPRYNKEELLQNSLPANSLAKDYKIVDYITATSGVFNLSKHSPLSSVAQNMKFIRLPADYAKPNWIGYIATSPDKGEGIDVVIVWRGTIMKTEWISNVLGVPLELWDPKQPHGPKVHRGFMEIYRDSNHNAELRPQAVVQKRLRSLLEDPKIRIRSVTTTGHSLGGALAIISAADVAQFLRSDLKLSNPPPVTAFPFAPPQPGDQKFKEYLLSDLKVPILATVNCRDVVPDVPNTFAPTGEADPAQTGSFLDDTKATIAEWLAKHSTLPRAPDLKQYVRVGAHLNLDSWNSLIVKHGRTEGGAEDAERKSLAAMSLTEAADVLNLQPRFGRRHNMEQYLWLVATQHGGQTEPEGPTDEVGGRDWALLNKGDDELLKKFQFPGGWWGSEGGPKKTPAGLWRMPATK